MLLLLSPIAVPSGQFREEHLFGDVDTRLAGGIAAVLLVLFVTASFLMVHMVRRRRDRQDPVNQGALTLGQHPNVVRVPFPLPPLPHTHTHTHTELSDG